MEMRIPIYKQSHYDVVVAGGGTAGFCAAIAAARSGAKTCVIERFGALGGTMTIGGVNAPALFHAHGRQIISGIGWELMTRLAEKGYASLPKPPFTDRHPLLAVEINPFHCVQEMDEMAIEAGLEVRFHQQVAHAETENGFVTAIAVLTVEGMERITAKTFIDCTGDGSLCAMAGAQFELSEELQPATLNFYLSGQREDEDDVASVRKKYEEALAKGELAPEDVWGGGIGSFVHGRGRKDSRGFLFQQNPGCNANHVYPFNGASAESRTKGEIEGRRSIARLIRWVNKNVKGCENAYVKTVTPTVSARESRRIIGNAYITGDDYINGVAGADAVAYSFYPIDVHRGDTKSALDNEFHREGLVPGIPYGALCAKGFKNLLMAGRIASGDRRAQSAYRVQASCMAMGEAVGTAAAMAAKVDVPASDIDVQALRALLKKNGAIVPEV